MGWTSSCHRRRSQTVYIDREGKLILMSIYRCKRYNSDDKGTKDNEELDNPAETALQEDTKVRQDFDEIGNETWDIVNNDEVFSSFLVKLLQSDDPRAKEADFIEAKENKVEGL